MSLLLILKIFRRCTDSSEVGVPLASTESSINPTSNESNDIGLNVTPTESSVTEASSSDYLNLIDVRFGDDESKINLTNTNA